MSDVTVLVVDDSAAMRALFCDILDETRGVEVIGTARNADEARDKIAELSPDVLTLDVEMPGMTGMEFLAEIMQSNPMPVIMLSSVTQDGTGTAKKALELGAFHCFPKPLHTSPEEFKVTVDKLGALVIAAASAEVSAKQPDAGKAASGAGSFQSDGRLVALAASADSIEILREIIAAYPANCPPTVALVDAEPDLVARAVDRLRPSVACKIEDATSDTILIEGCVYIACNKDLHVLIEDDFAPMLKLVDKDPIAGHRPSADMLFASIARSGTPAMGGILAADHKDGVRGLEALAKTGAKTFVQNADTVGPNTRFTAIQQLSLEMPMVDGKEIPAWILGETSKHDMAA